MTNAEKAELKEQLQSKAFQTAVEEILAELPFPNAQQVLSGQYTKDATQHLFMAGIMHAFNSLYAKTALARRFQAMPRPGKQLHHTTQPA